MKSFLHNTLIVPKFVFSLSKELFFIKLMLFLVFQPLVSQEYVTQSFGTISHDSSYNTLIKIIEDEKGFLWYTTHNELVHELGTHTFSYSLKTFPNEVIDIKNYTSLYEDSSGNIWVLSDSDVRKFNKNTQKVTSYKLINPKDQSLLIPNSVTQLTNGNIYFGTQFSFIVELNASNGQLTYHNAQTQHLSQPITKIIGSSDNTLVTKSNNQIQIFEANQELILIDSFPTNTSDHLLMNNALIFDSRASGFYFYNNTRYKYHLVPSIQKYVVEFPKPTVNVSRTLSSSDFLIQTDFDTVVFFRLINHNNRLELDQQNEFKYPNQIQDIYVGENKIIWLSSLDMIHKIILNEKQFTNSFIQDSFGNNLKVSAFVKNSMGTSFAATDKGLYIVNEERKLERVNLSHKEPPQNTMQPYFKDIWMQNDSIIWGVNQSDLIYKIHIKTGTILKFSDESNLIIKGSKFIHLAPKNDSQLYLGCFGGLYSFDINEHVFKSENSIITDFDFRGLTVFDTLETDNYFWIASVAGLHRINKKNQKTSLLGSRNYSSFPNQTNFTTLFVGSEGFLWAGSNNGLFKIEQQSLEVIKHFNRVKGLSDNTVRGIQESNQFIWIITPKGLSKIHKLTDNIQNFHKNQGLLDENFNVKSFYKASDSLFYAGTKKGLVSFDPTQVNRSSSSYSVYPVELKFYNQLKGKFFSVTSNFENYQTIELPNAYSSLFFSFAMNNLISPKLNNIFYRISSLSSEWILLDDDSTVKLYGLQSGKYTLEVRGTSELGSPSQNILTYTINVPYPFYFQWWFILVIFSLIALTLYLWFYFEATVLKINRDRSLQISNLELRAFRAQMNPHFIFNALNGLQSTMVLQGEKAFNNYMGTFSKLIRHTIEMSSSDQVTLVKEIEYLKNYVALQSLRLDSKIDLTITVQKPIVSSFIYLPCMILQPIVENAILHGLMNSNNEKKIDINFFFEDGFLNCYIRDNGIGREAAEKRKKVYQSTHQSFATSILNKRMELLNTQNEGQFFFNIEDMYNENNQPTGTLVVIGIPINYNPEV